LAKRKTIRFWTLLAEEVVDPEIASREVRAQQPVELLAEPSRGEGLSHHHPPAADEADRRQALRHVVEEPGRDAR